VERSAREVGIGFCFAPQFHSGLRHAAQARREIGIPTVFNFIAPLLNPAQPRSGAVGCSVESMAPVIAEVFAKRGCSVVVVRGEDGLDEVSTSAPTRMWIAADGVVRQAVVDVADLGIPRALQEELRGGDAAYNASVVRSVLAGKPGPALDSSLVNAATAIAAYRGVDTDVLASLRSGLVEARAAVETGAAEAVLARWVNFTATKD
jgi:anthranilate phosphoribosyltransferase